jgi:hypothetical protein
VIQGLDREPLTVKAFLAAPAFLLVIACAAQTQKAILQQHPILPTPSAAHHRGRHSKTTRELGFATMVSVLLEQMVLILLAQWSWFLLERFCNNDCKAKVIGLKQKVMD